MKDIQCPSGQHIRRNGKPPKCKCKATTWTTDKEIARPFVVKALEEELKYVDNLHSLKPPTIVATISGGEWVRKQDIKTRLSSQIEKYKEE